MGCAATLMTVLGHTCRYVATELVKQLLEKGYFVRGTLRSLATKEKYSHLVALGDALPGKLTLHEVSILFGVQYHNSRASSAVTYALPCRNHESCMQADLLVEGSFDEVVKSADYVFHTASPFIT